MAGSSSTQLTSNVDVAPTALEALDIETPKKMSGHSLLERSIDRPFVFSENNQGKEYMVRSGVDKLLFYRNSSFCRYFNLEEDPHEMVNRYEDPVCQGRIAEMKEALSHWLMFEAPTPVHLDYEAKCIASPDGHEDREKYFRNAMTK